VNRIPGILSEPCTLTVNLVALHQKRRACSVRLGATRPPLKRMAAITHKLAAGELFNATTLSRELGISIKTAQRDLDFLRSDLGAEMEYDPKRYGYRLRKEAA
jgi:hypothetical protein